MKYFTSDYHFNHANVIKYCNRPFNSVEDMNGALLHAWNSVVKPEDTVYFLGDFCFNSDKALEWLRKLNGTIIFISGNHDKTFVFKNKSKHIKWIELYKKAGCSEIHQQLELTLKNGAKVLLNHFPYLQKNEQVGGDIRYLEYRPINKGMTLLHGHSHCHYVKNKNMIDVGIDHSFKLYSEDEIIEIINSKEEFIPSRVTEFYAAKKAERGDI